MMGKGNVLACPWVSCRLLCLLLIGLCALSRTAQADPSDSEGLEFFEKRIRPVLVEHCYKCHSAQVKKPKGDLRLDTRDGIRAGGESGHAVVPRDLDQSLLIRALRYEDLEMPPAGPLDESIIADFEAWIEMGAPDPRDEAALPVQASTPVDFSEARQFWAFQPPRAVEPPAVTNASWAFNDIDRFLLARQQRAGVAPVVDADRSTLLRRVYFDLVGLPPTPNEIEVFEQDPSPQAFAHIVDQLLDSSQFGERWARHWLDVVRYAESTGRTRNFPYPFAWRYRDYVIQSLNADKPYDRFITEQLAGDLLPAASDAERDHQLIATGFLALGAHDLNENDNDVFRMDVVGDQVDVTARSMMALTLGCARCHDHKFDPIPTVDYYALAGIFRNSELLSGYTNRRRNRQFADSTLLLKLSGSDSGENESTQEVSVNGPDTAQPDARARLQTAQQQVARLRQRVQNLEPSEDPDQAAAVSDLREKLRLAQQRFGKLKQKLAATPDGEQVPLRGPYTMGVQEAARITDCPVYEGGDVDRRGAPVPRGFLQVVSVADPPMLPNHQSGRLELAEWLTRSDHPLTARVMVNRVWHHLFGQGLVTTVDNFGAMGSRPSHPELLDYLSIQFVQDGWSVKRLIRSLVMSHAYQTSGMFDADNFEIDPDNRLIWRMTPRRLEAEAIRDTILQVSGQLQLDPPHGSPIQELPIAPLRNRRPPPDGAASFTYRSIYLPIVRSGLPQYLTTFDFPEPSDVKGDRDVTTVATQALFMMNSPLIHHHSRLAAEQLLQDHTAPERLVQHAYLMTLSRPPTAEQRQRAVDYLLAAQRDADRSRRAARMVAVTDLVQALIGSAEFRYH